MKKSMIAAAGALLTLALVLTGCDSAQVAPGAAGADKENTAVFDEITSRGLLAEADGGPFLLHGAEPGLLDELIQAFGRRGRSLRLRVEAGLDLGRRHQILEADAGRFRRLAAACAPGRRGAPEGRPVGLPQVAGGRQ